MFDPRRDDALRDFVISQGVDEYLPPSRELTSENTMRTVCFVERSAFISNGSAEVLGSVLVLELLDSIALCSLEQETNHGVVEATVDEVIDHRTELCLAAELVEITHLLRTWCIAPLGSRGCDERSQSGKRRLEIDLDVG